MRRVVTFAEDDRSRQRFRHLYEAFMVSSLIEPRKGIAAARDEVRLEDKLNAISTASTTVKLPTDDYTRELVGACDLSLDEPEFELLKKAIEVTIGGWKQSLKRAVLDTHDWLSATPQSEAG